MNRGFAYVLFGLLLSICVVGALGNADSRSSERRFLDLLEIEQTVGVKEVPGGFEITVTKDWPGLQKVVAIGDEYLTIEDPNGFTKLTIPIYQIRCLRYYDTRTIGGGKIEGGSSKRDLR
jgi:hypothetical protein